MRLPSPVLCAALFVLSLGLSSCGSSDSDQASSVASNAPTTSTTVDPFAVPEVIDVAYVDKVLGEIYKARDGVTQSVSQTQTFTSEDEAAIRSIYIGDLANRQVEVFRRGASEPHSEASKTQFSEVESQRLIRSDSTCMYAESRVTGPGGSTLFAHVFQRTPASPTNQTGWSISQGTLPDMIDQNQSC